MTTKDKTGDQLMASIRKTKTETTGDDQGTERRPEAATATSKAAAAKPKPAAAAAAAATAKATRVTKKKVVARPKASQTGPRSIANAYQSPGRVWPD